MTNISPLPQKRTLGDYAHMLTRATISSVPGVGAFAVELFGEFVSKPLDNRREAWMQDMGKLLGDLEAKQAGIVEELQANPAFIDTVMIASQAATRTSDRQKLEALKNAVRNSATGKPTDVEASHLYLRMVDEFSGSHLALLAFLADPQAAFSTRGVRQPDGGLDRVWDALSLVMPEASPHEGHYELMCVDLHRRGLLILRSLHDRARSYHYDPERPRERQMGYSQPWESANQTYVQRPRTIRPWTTKLGDAFLEFVSAPEGPDSY